MSTKLKIMLKETTLPMLYITVVVVGAGLLAQEKTEVLSDWHFYLAFALLIIGGSLLTMFINLPTRSNPAITSVGTFMRCLLYRLIVGAVTLGVILLVGAYSTDILSSPWLYLIWIGGALIITLLELLIDRL